MRLLQRWRTSFDKTTGSPPDSNECLDLLSDLVQTWGRHAFDLDRTPAHLFRERCEAWSRHIRTGAPPPTEGPEALSEGPRRRAFADLRAYLSQHRQAEAAFVMRSVSNLQGTVREVIADLWSSISEGAQDDREILSRLEELEGAIQQGDPEVIRAQATQAVRVIGRTIQQRQHRQDARLSTLRNQLGRVRADLMEARNQNTIDALTGLKNRGALDADLERMAMLAEISAEPLSAALLDLDHFKWVNDTYGHQAGDAVLKRTAEEMIRAFPRKSDYLARYGGEEFTVVLPNTSAIDALRLVNRFLESMRALEVELGNQKIKVTCSAGVATLNERETQMDLLKRADAALYRAKSAGRDQAKLAD